MTDAPRPRAGPLYRQLGLFPTLARYVVKRDPDGRRLVYVDDWCRWLLVEVLGRIRRRAPGSRRRRRRP